MAGRTWDKVQDSWRGVALCLLIALPAWFLGRRFDVIGGPVFAILIGMVLALFIKDDAALPFAPGVKFTSKKILQYAVILLGFGLNLSQIARVGARSLPIIVATITTSLVISFALHRALKIPTKISTLVGVGSSICGGSAIAATAPVIDADDEEIAQAISVIFLFNIIAALIFPALGGMLGLSNEGFGLFAGTAVNDTSSVVAAGYAFSDLAGQFSTIVKLTRTLAIIPITLVLAFLYTRKGQKSQGKGVSLKSIFPFFILYFIAASLLTTVAVHFGVDASVFSPIKTLSKFFIVLAMAAIGLNTDIVKLIKTGGAPLALGACCWVGITGTSLLIQHVMGLW